MPRWPRPPNLLRLLVGQHIINGVSVGLGVRRGRARRLGDLSASPPASRRRLARYRPAFPIFRRHGAKRPGRSVFGFALALFSTVAIQLALPWPVAALLMIGVISFVGGLVTGLGRWAVAVGMQAVIPMVFILGFPRETFPAAVRIEILLAGGGVAYIAFALLATVFTDPSARRMVASETIREFSIYLRAVAAIFDPDQDLAAAYGATIRQQSALVRAIAVGAGAFARTAGENGRAPAACGLDRHPA